MNGCKRVHCLPGVCSFASLGQSPDAGPFVEAHAHCTNSDAAFLLSEAGEIAHAVARIGCLTDKRRSKVSFMCVLREAVKL